MSEPNFPVERAVEAVMARLALRRDDSPDDVYVWSDGRVTGPRPEGTEVDELRVISLFTPGPMPSADEVRTSIARGLAAAE